MKAQLKRASSVFLRGNSRGSAAVSIHTYLGQLKAQEIKFYDAESSRVALAAKLAIWPFGHSARPRPKSQQANAIVVVVAPPSQLNFCILQSYS